MFTGIVETTGQIQSIESKGSNLSFWINSKITEELKPDQSLSHNGVCLTVEEIKGGAYKVTAIRETLEKTTLGNWEEGNIINLERCLQLNGRLDGHIVQGHVDTKAVCTQRTEKDGSTEFSFQIEKKFAPLIIEKGSISINGISLTIFNVTVSDFTVAIIPYTMNFTNMSSVHPGTEVNVEFDIIGKYVTRLKSMS